MRSYISTNEITYFKMILLENLVKKKILFFCSKYILQHLYIFKTKRLLYLNFIVILFIFLYVIFK